jgi:hypothetical protein
LGWGGGLALPAGSIPAAGSTVRPPCVGGGPGLGRGARGYNCGGGLGAGDVHAERGLRALIGCRPANPDG